LQQKLKKEINWTWTTNDTKIVQNFKNMCKRLPVHNLPNKEDDLVLETDVSNEHWSIVLKNQRRQTTLQILQLNF